MSPFDNLLLLEQNCLTTFLQAVASKQFNSIFRAESHFWSLALVPYVDHCPITIVIASKRVLYSGNTDEDTSSMLNSMDLQRQTQSRLCTMANITLSFVLNHKNHIYWQL
jgi:hypothetical protein